MITTKDLPALKERFRTLIRQELNLACFKERDDGDFTFRYERMDMKLVFEDSDASFIWLARFGFHWLKRPSPAELAQADRCINSANYRVKTAKVVRTTEPDGDGDYGITASVSLFIENVESQDAATLERYLHQIKTAVRGFYDALEADEETEDEKPAAVAPADVGLRH